MTNLNQTPQIVRYGELQPCKTAFIDAHTPGSDQKENFTIIGGGVSESPDQHVHINETPGFNIGAAGQPPHCRNSLHSHVTAEVFFVLKGRWRFFWGRNGDAGEFIAEEGDIFNIPTGIFRGFENVGIDYGMIMAVLGGNDAGGGVIWAPEVIKDAAAHGLILGDNGKLYDRKKGQDLPADVKPMPLLDEAELKKYPEPTADDVMPHYVARYQDMLAMATRRPARVLGADAMIVDRPGFEIDLLKRGSISSEAYSTGQSEIIMIMHGHWRLEWQSGSAILAPGDTCSVPKGLSRKLAPSMTGNASLFRVRSTDDEAGLTRALV